MAFSEGDQRDKVFHWKDISLRQGEGVLKIGTDAILLGAWISHLNINPQNILDAGCGTGILSLMMAQQFPDARIEAIDINEMAIELSQNNFNNSLWPARLFARMENIFQPPSPHTRQYDFIISNPPYYADKKMTALTNHPKHADAAPTEWIVAMDQRLMKGGQVSIVLPYHQVHDWVNAANNTGWYNQNRLDIFSFKDDTSPKRSLIHFGSQLTKPLIKNLVIHDSPGSYTKEYLAFSGVQFQNNHEAGMSKLPVTSERNGNK